MDSYLRTYLELNIIMLEFSPYKNSFLHVGALWDGCFCTSVILESTPGSSNIIIVVRGVQFAEQSHIRIKLAIEC